MGLVAYAQSIEDNDVSPRIHLRTVPDEFNLHRLRGCLGPIDAGWERSCYYVTVVTRIQHAALSGLVLSPTALAISEMCFSDHPFPGSNIILQPSCHASSALHN